MTDSLSPIDATQLPAEVRKAGPEAQKLYAAALSFESVLTRQLGEALTSTLQDDGSGSDGSDDGAGGMYTQLLPDAFAQGVAGAGGLGLADQLYEALKP
jgi:Rod binding domain-containing protein